MWYESSSADSMKIISTIFYTLFVALVIGIAGLLLGTMLPIPGNIEVKIVKSGSMEPAIPTGSLVVVKPAPIYTKGDIVTFGEDTKTKIPTTHRIITANADGTFVTKGDANEEQDPNPIARREIIGKVIFSVPGAGYVLDFARTKLGFALLIGIPAGLVILEELLTITRETQKWYRGRRGRRDDGGTPLREEVLDLRTHLKRVYAKRRHMDEIKVAMYVEPRWYEALWWRKKLGLDRDAYGTSTSLTVGLVFFSCVFAGHSGGTISYFQDVERSLNNMLTAGIWEDATPEEEQLVPFAAFTADEEGSEGAVLGTSDEETPAPPPADDPAGDPGAPAEEPPPPSTQESETTPPAEVAPETTPSEPEEPTPPADNPEPPAPAPEPPPSDPAPSDSLPAEAPPAAE